MPVINGVGQSDETPTKQDHFAGFLKVQLAASSAVMSNPRYTWCNGDYYQYFDLYAGNGTWGEGEDGSPLIFLNTIREMGMKFHAVFIDKNPDSIEQLKRRIPYDQLPYCTLIADDNLMAMRPYLKVTKEKPRMGLLYADPNGVVCWDLLRWASRMKRYERTDILVYFSANRGYKLHRRVNPDKHKFLTEYIEGIDKKHWLIREPHNRHQWTFLYGTRWRNVPEWRRAGFYDITSKQGRAVLHKCNWTASERDELRQASLF